MWLWIGTAGSGVVHAVAVLAALPLWPEADFLRCVGLAVRFRVGDRSCVRLIDRLAVLFA